MTTETVDNETGEITETPFSPEEPKELLRQARELVPVNQIAQPENLAQLIDLAKAMSKARYFLPEHMHDNVGDCMAVWQIATQAGLIPNMLAMQTYVDPKTKRIAFMSQAFHALATPWLRGDFEVEYSGEGEERTCTVSGILKADPTRVRSHTSPPLKQVRPKKNDEGVVKGSPLWTRKPDVQLFYDTSRDWVRIFCPRATMGIYTPEELAEYGPDMARDVTPPGPGLSKRLRSTKVSREEGHKEGAAAEAVQEAKNGGDRTVAPQSTEPTSEAPPPAKKASSRRKTPPAGEEPKPAAPAAEPKEPKGPTTPKEWEVYAMAWLKQETDAHEINLRWKGERSLRNACGVTSEFRDPVEKFMLERLKELQS